MNTNTRIALVSVLFIVGIYGTIVRLQRTSRCRDLSCIHMTGSESYTLKETYADTSDVYRAMYASGERILRLESKNIPADASRDALNEEVARMKAMFEKAPAPYPGDISDAIVCDPKYQPVFTNVDHSGTSVSLFTGYLNQRMTFGSCSSSQAVYRGYLAFFYCPRQHSLIRLELIEHPDTPATETERITRQLDSISCPSPR